MCEDHQAEGPAITVDDIRRVRDLMDANAVVFEEVKVWCPWPKCKFGAYHPDVVADHYLAAHLKKD